MNQKIGSERNDKNNRANNQRDFARKVRRFESRQCARKTISVNAMDRKNAKTSHVLAASTPGDNEWPQAFGNTKTNQAIARGSQRRLPMPVRTMNSRCIRLPNGRS
jgi:anti-sigma factor RsiW